MDRVLTDCLSLSSYPQEDQAREDQGQVCCSQVSPPLLAHATVPHDAGLLLTNGARRYYKVDSEGKIKRLRRECPSASCGPSVFMASHHDRQTCGRCGLTYKLDVAE